MKAHEYATRITEAHAAGDDDALRDAITAAVRGVASEGAEMFRRRGRRAAPGIAREMDEKWRAIANRCPPGILNPNGWRDLMVSRDPEMGALFGRRAP